MTWIRPKSICIGVWKGICRYYDARDNHIFTNAQLKAAEEAAETLKKCKPATDYFTPRELSVLRESLREGDVNTANDIIDCSVKMNGRHWCYDALRYAIAIYNTCSPDALRGATYGFIYDQFI